MHLVKAVIIFFIALVAFARFAPQTNGNPQHVTRVALAIEMIEGRLEIDRFAQWTIDKAHDGEHYYSDKPPGLSLLAVPGIAATRAILSANGGSYDPTDRETLHKLITVAAFSTVCLFSALAVALLYLFALRLGAGETAALFASATLAFATPFFAWSSTFFAHPLSGSLLLIAAAIVGWNERARREEALWRGVATGLVLGYLMVVDLTTAPAASLIGLWALVRSEDRVREFAGLALGGIVGIAPLLIYNYLAFGNPLKLGYSQVVGFVGMKGGLFGLSMPDPWVAGELLFGRFRGLLPLSPVLLLVPFGLWRMWQEPRLRGIAMVIAGTMLCFLLINASYYYWDGGGSTGPRHLVAMLPLAALALAFAWPPRVSQQVVVVLLLAGSLFLSWVVATVEVFANARLKDPMWDFLLPSFFTEEYWARAYPVPFHWVAFASLLFLKPRSGTQRDKVPARPLEPAVEVKL